MQYRIEKLIEKETSARFLYRILIFLNERGNYFA